MSLTEELAGFSPGGIGGERQPNLYHQRGVLGAGFAAVDGGFGAPLGGEAAHSLIDAFVEAEQVADNAAVEQGAVGVGVGQVGGFQLPVAEVVEDGLGGGKLVVAEDAEVQDREGFGGVNGHVSASSYLTTGMPPVAEKAQRTVTPHSECVVKAIILKDHIRPSATAYGFLSCACYR